MNALRNVRRGLALCLMSSVLCAGASGEVRAAKAGKKGTPAEDRYASYVWPPPPDPPRIRLVDVIEGRLDVEAESRWKRMLLGATPASPYDRLEKPFAVWIDARGRLLVTDSASGALIRFDRKERRMDVFGTQGATHLRTPLGLGEGPDGAVYVADAGLRKVVAFDGDGRVKAVYGKEGELLNPTDAAVSPDGRRLFVADSRAHLIRIFDIAGGALVSSFGKLGQGEGEFNVPTSLVFGPGGNLYVVDQLNARVQIVSADGQYLGQIGQRGVAYGNLVRPKDVAVDEKGIILVSDNAFNNIQVFGADFGLLTFVGEGGFQPGQFAGASGVALRGDEFAAVDQLGHRVQLFRFLRPATAR